MGHIIIWPTYFCERLEEKNSNLGHYELTTRPRHLIGSKYQSQSLHVPQEIPTTFGIITLQPYFWELLLLDKSEYTESSRLQFSLEAQGWQKQRVQVG